MSIIVPVLHIFEVEGFIWFDRVVNSIKSDLNPKINKTDINISSDYKDGLIKDISIVSHNKVGKKFYKPAFDYIPKKIINKQIYNIDAVNGSTYSLITKDA